MNLAFRALKKFLPELNERIICPEDLFDLYERLDIEFYEIPLQGNGYYIREGGSDYIFLKYFLRQLLRHETILHETVHALIHYPFEYLTRKQNLEAEVFALIGMMPISELPKKIRIKDSLDPEEYELLERRLKVVEIWGL